MNETIRAGLTQTVSFARRKTLRQIWQELDKRYPEVHPRNIATKLQKKSN